MADIFISITNMSVNAVWLIAAVIILRFFLKNMSKKYVMALWALVAIRLMCPFTIESVLSLIPSADIVSEVTSEYGKPVGEPAGNPIIVNGADSAADNSADNSTDNSTDNAERMIDPVMKGSADTSVEYGRSIFEMFFGAAEYVWCAVFVLLLLYLAVSYVYMRKKTDAKMYLDDKIWLCDGINIPFILGIVKPQIYLPSSINIVQSDYVIKHEKMHIKYYDYIWKPLGFLILAVHWFNPFVWAAYILFARDMELACDERVIKGMNLQSRKDYSRVLLELSTGKRNITVCPLAFGEVGVKQRIKQVLNYRKPAFWAGVAAIAACIAVAVCFFTNPVSRANDIIKDVAPEIEEAVSKAILDENAPESADEYICEDHVTFGMSKPQDGIVDVYAMVLCNGYVMSDGGTRENSGYHAPNVITLQKNEDGSYTCREIWHPLDGAGYESSIHDRFPREIWDDAVDTQKYITEQSERCYAKAQEYFDHNMEDGNDTDSSDNSNIDNNNNNNSGADSNSSKAKDAAGSSYDDVKAYLAGLPDDADKLVKAGCFAITYNGISGVENWNEFSSSVSNGQPAELVCAQYTVEGDAIFDYMYYNGSDIYHVCDFRRDMFSAGSEDDKCYEERFQYIKVFDNVENDGDKVKYVVLTDKEGLTLDEYEKITDSEEYNPETSGIRIIADIVYGNEHADITGKEAWHDLSYTYDMSKDLISSKKVSSIVVTNAETGQTLEYTANDKDKTFRDLLKLYYNLNAMPDKDNEIGRSGYAYKMELKNSKGKIQQTVIPYKDSVRLNYKMYNCKDNGTSCELLIALNNLGWSVY